MARRSIYDPFGLSYNPMTISPKLLSVAALFVLVGAGCNPLSMFQKQAEDAAQKAAMAGVEGSIEASIKQNTGKDVDVEFENDGASYTDPETGDTFAMGDNVAIPSDFPQDMPRYPGSTPKSVSLTGELDASLLVETSDKRAAVRSWVEAEFPKAGWTSDGTVESADMVILTFSRSENGGTARAVVTISPPSVQEKTNIVMTRKGVKKE